MNRTELESLLTELDDALISPTRYFSLFTDCRKT